MSDFDLIYIEKDTNKIYHAKRLLFSSYKIREPMRPESEKKITRHELKKKYRYQSRISDRNVRQKCRPILMREA